MGVKGLLKSLRSIENQTHISSFNGLALAIDGYAWLHRGVISCPRQLALGLPTTGLIDYVLKRTQILLDNNIKPYFVFDGDYLPMKAKVEDEREASRSLAKEKGMEYWSAGEHTKAMEQFQKAVDITPEMAANVINVLKQHNIDYVVAPYEADSQMVWLEMQDIVQGIIAEDSDLLVFGAKRLLTKFDSNSGSVIEIHRDRFPDCKELQLACLNQAQLRSMAILSGCDYSDGIPNVGLTKANKLARRFTSLTRVLRAVRLDGSYKVPYDFDTIAKRADLTFQHQRVYDIYTKELKMLNEPGYEITEPEFESFIGTLIDNELAVKVANGDMNPMTKELIDKSTFIKPGYQLVRRVVPIKRTIKSFFTPSTPKPNLLQQSQLLTPQPTRASSYSTISKSFSSTHSTQKRAYKLLNSTPTTTTNCSKFFTTSTTTTATTTNTRKNTINDKENIDPMERNTVDNDTTSDVELTPPGPKRVKLIDNESISPVKPQRSTSAPQLAFKPGTLDKFLYKKVSK